VLRAAMSATSSVKTQGGLTMSGATIKVPVRMNKLKAHRVEWRRGSRPMETLRSEIDRLLDDFLRGYWHIPFKRSTIDVEPYWRGDVTLGTTPAVDIVEGTMVAS
jgi:HSP20 family protein